MTICSSKKAASWRASLLGWGGSKHLGVSTGSVCAAVCKVSFCWQPDRPGRRDRLTGNCFESMLNSQTTEKLLLLCNWLCIYSCAVSVEADTKVGLLSHRVRPWSGTLRELQRRDKHKSLLMDCYILSLCPFCCPVRQVSQPLPGSAGVGEESCRKINPWNSLVWLVHPSLCFLDL